jgi:hypothetical protein
MGYALYRDLYATFCKLSLGIRSGTSEQSKWKADAGATAPGMTWLSVRITCPSALAAADAHPLDLGFVVAPERECGGIVR